MSHTNFIIEDETENELSAYDIWHAQFCEAWRLLHEFSHDAEGEHSKANDVFDEDHFDDICKANALLSEQCEAVFSAEDSWGWTKSHHRTHCTYNYKDLKAGLPITLEEKLPIAFVRGRAFDQCLRFMNGYRDGLTGAVLEYAVKKYKSHRRLSPSINLNTIEEEYWEKKKTQMTFKRCE